jgi:hypothetical protein
MGPRGVAFIATLRVTPPIIDEEPNIDRVYGKDDMNGNWYGGYNQGNPHKRYQFPPPTGGE